MQASCQEINTNAIKKSLLNVFQFNDADKIVLENFVIYLQIMIDALEHFCEMKLTYFDALVGENACQMRGLKFTQMALDYNNDKQFALMINRTLKRIKSLHAMACETIDLAKKMDFMIDRLYLMHEKWRNKLLSPDHEELWRSSKKDLNKGKNASRAILVNALLSSLGSAEVDEDVSFIIHAYLLTITKDGDAKGYDCFGFPIGEESNPKLLMEKYGCTIRTATLLMKASKKQLAKASLEYMRSIAEEFNNSTLKDRLSDIYIIYNDCDVPCGPCYYEFYCLILKAKAVKAPIVVRVKFTNGDKIEEMCLLYKGAGLGIPFVHVDPESEDLTRPALIVTGICKNTGGLSASDLRAKIFDSFRMHGLEKIMLAVAAQHEQYPKAVNSIPMPINDDLGLHENLCFAEKHGFSMQNPGICLIKHIYSDIIGKHLNSIEV